MNAFSDSDGLHAYTGTWAPRIIPEKLALTCFVYWHLCFFKCLQWPVESTRTCYFHPPPSLSPATAIPEVHITPPATTAHPGRGIPHQLGGQGPRRLKYLVSLQHTAHPGAAAAATAAALHAGRRATAGLAGLAAAAAVATAAAAA